MIHESHSSCEEISFSPLISFWCGWKKLNSSTLIIWYQVRWSNNRTGWLARLLIEVVNVFLHTQTATTTAVIASVWLVRNCSDERSSCFPKRARVDYSANNWWCLWGWMTSEKACLVRLSLSNYLNITVTFTCFLSKRLHRHRLEYLIIAICWLIINLCRSWLWRLRPTVWSLSQNSYWITLSIWGLWVLRLIWWIRLLWEYLRSLND